MGKSERESVCVRVCKRESVRGEPPGRRGPSKDPIGGRVCWSPSVASAGKVVPARGEARLSRVWGDVEVHCLFGGRWAGFWLHGQGPVQSRLAGGQRSRAAPGGAASRKVVLQVLLRSPRSHSAIRNNTAGSDLFAGQEMSPRSFGETARHRRPALVCSGCVRRRCLW